MIEQSYTKNRNDFIEAAQLAGARLFEISHPKDTTLKTDIAVMGKDDASRVVLVVSGVHGVELPAGSLLQTIWLPEVQKILPLLPDTKFVFVHALNPYGAEHGMRTDWDSNGQGNIDPARNFIDFKEATNTANAGIEQALSGVDLTVSSLAKMWVKLLYSAFMVQGKSVFKEGFVRGQYSNPDIPYFGGTAPSFTRLTWDKVIQDFVQGVHVERIWHLDCHTGDGPFGLLQLYINDKQGDHVLKNAYDIMHEDHVHVTEFHFAKIAGDIVDYWPQCGVQNAKITPMTLEFGTSSAMIEGIDVLNAILTRTILQNRYSDCHPQADKIIQRMRDAFAPRDPEWERAVRLQSEMIWEEFKKVLQGLGLFNA